MRTAELRNGVPTTPRSAAEVLAWTRVAVEPAMRAAVDTLPNAMRQIAGYHFGWWNERGAKDHAGGGKAIRPALVLLCAEAVGGASEQALPAAVGAELVHNFSLLHDDVMDGDHTRRHRRTAWHVFGINAAILAGDALLALAVETVAADGHPQAKQATRMLAAAVRALVTGQSADMDYERRPSVELSECVDMVESKTGALLATSCAVGALVGGGSADQVHRLREFGRCFGLAFQHVDDLLGIWGDPSVTGKPVHSDLRSRKKSLPVVAALNSDTPAGHELRALYRSDHPLSEPDLIQAAELVDHAQGRAWSQAQARTLLADAVDLLNSTNLAPTTVAELIALARLAVRRDH